MPVYLYDHLSVGTDPITGASCILVMPKTLIKFNSPFLNLMNEPFSIAQVILYRKSDIKLKKNCQVCEVIKRLLV